MPPSIVPVGRSRHGSTDGGGRKSGSKRSITQALAGIQLGLKWPFWERPSGALFKAVIAEGLGTMFLVFVGTGTVVFGCHSRDTSTGPAAAGQIVEPEDCFLNVSRVLTIAAAFGFVIGVLVYATAPYSGGHLNPAITLAMVISRKITLMRAALYWAIQIGGAILGSAFVYAIDRSGWHAATGGANRLLPGITDTAGWTLEMLLTLMIVFVVFAATDTARAADRPHLPILAPFAIGFAFFVAHLTAVAIDGCSVNPARSFGPSVVAGGDAWDDQYIFWLGPLTGGVFAALIYEIIFRPSRHKTEPSSDDEAARNGGRDSFDDDGAIDRADGGGSLRRRVRPTAAQLPQVVGTPGAREVDMTGMRMILVPKARPPTPPSTPPQQQQQQPQHTQGEQQPFIASSNNV